MKTKNTKTLSGIYLCYAPLVVNACLLCFSSVFYLQEEFDKDLIPIEESFKPLVLKCKELGRAMRIGTNHGSLSARVLSFYGDTPRGMVESAVEFANICRCVVGSLSCHPRAGSG